MIVFLGFNVWNTVENSQKFLPVSAGGSFLKALPSREFVGKDGRQHLFNGDMVSLRNAPSLVIELFRDLDAYAHILLSRTFNLDCGLLRQCARFSTTVFVKWHRSWYAYLNHTLASWLALF